MARRFLPLFANVRRFNVDAPITVTIGDCGRSGETWVNILQRSLETRSINAMHLKINFYVKRFKKDKIYFAKKRKNSSLKTRTKQFTLSLKELQSDSHIAVHSATQNIKARKFQNMILLSFQNMILLSFFSVLRILISKNWSNFILIEKSIIF